VAGGGRWAAIEEASRYPLCRVFFRRTSVFPPLWQLCQMNQVDQLDLDWRRIDP